ncbi:uncharacterized protein LOC121417240 isoform X1 [Lytechinus variegatus]|uniref:uncharacterized protein LOC121417240 isoform X1 n=1 Tax=Lytechinus variegatus TaxID=7654 RepID=UPI001BB146AF|nr:uncharacterized protein LOC121417240 isoform X1 [Lytechinus variegatus]
MKRRKPEEVAKHYISCGQDPDWIQQKWVNKEKAGSSVGVPTLGPLSPPRVPQTPTKERLDPQNSSRCNDGAGSSGGVSAPGPLCPPRKNPTLVPLNRQEDSSRERRYTRWESGETAQLKEFFKEYFTSTQTKLPSRAEIRKFKMRFPAFRHDVRTIATKVMNEVRKTERLTEERVKRLGIR